MKRKKIKPEIVSTGSTGFIEAVTASRTNRRTGCPSGDHHHVTASAIGHHWENGRCRKSKCNPIARLFPTTSQEENVLSLFQECRGGGVPLIPKAQQVDDTWGESLVEVNWAKRVPSEMVHWRLAWRVKLRILQDE